MPDSKRDDRSLHVQYIQVPLSVPPEGIPQTTPTPDVRVQKLLPATESMPPVPPQVTIGRLLIEHEVRRHIDVRNLQEEETFVVTCTLHASIANNLGLVPIGYYFGEWIVPGVNWPLYNWWSSVAALTHIGLVTPYTGDPDLILERVLLLDYSPQTVNAAVNTSTTGGQSQSSAHTDGSSQTDSHDYQVSGSLFNWSLGGSGGQSWSATTEHSTTASSESNTDTSESFSLKDWGAYASVDAQGQIIRWLWAQEYPLNIVDYLGEFLFQENEPYVAVPLPPDVASLLYYTVSEGVGNCPTAPVPLSSFGFKTVSKAKWLIRPAPMVDPAVTTTVDVRPLLAYVAVSPDATSNAATAYLTAVPPNSGIAGTTLSNFPMNQKIALVPLSLDPITSSGSSNGAIVGFFLSQFIVPPGEDGKFRIVSGANNLCVIGEGFDPLTSHDAPTAASQITETSPAHFTILFKLVNDDDNLTLQIKHWKLSVGSCVLTITVNPIATDTGTSAADMKLRPPIKITRHVDWMDEGSGSNNVTRIILRNMDFMSPDFFDYLRLGLNKITITIKPQTPSEGCGYALRAISIS